MLENPFCQLSTSLHNCARRIVTKLFGVLACDWMHNYGASYYWPVEQDWPTCGTQGEYLRPSVTWIVSVTTFDNHSVIGLQNKMRQFTLQFDVFLTVHHSIDFSNYQLNAQFFYFSTIYRVSQEEWTKLRESVPYCELYRYNSKHLYPKLNGYGDNGQRSLKLWQLLHTYWLPNSY